LTLQLQRRRCSRLERFFIVEETETILFLKRTRLLVAVYVNFYNAGVVTHDREIDSRQYKCRFAVFRKKEKFAPSIGFEKTQK
jgi:hypothetical protein